MIGSPFKSIILLMNAGAGEVLLPADIFAALPATSKEALEVIETLEARVKGVDEPIPLVRIRGKSKAI